MFKRKERVITKHNIKRYINDGVLEIPDGFCEIADKAAYENHSIKKVIIPKTVDIIGDEAFCNSALEEVDFKPRYNTLLIKSYAFANTRIKKVNLCFDAILEESCFEGCSFLEEALLGVYITEIPKCCFKGTALNQIILHDNIKKIGRAAFSNTRISEIRIPDTINIIEEKAFSNNGWLKNVEAFDLQYIPDSTFENCGFLEKVTINYQKEFSNCGLILGNSVFNNCSKLKSIELVGGYISSIGSHAFSHCIELREIDLSLTKRIGEWAFSRAKSLRELGQLKQIQEISRYAFSECYFLNNLVFGENISTIGDSAFHRCKRLKKVELPKFLLNLGSAVFSECTSLESVLISSIELESFPNNTFHKCIALKSVTFDNGCEIKRIEHLCFCDCVSLAEILLPKNLEFIGERAFFNCKSLSGLSFEASQLIIEDNAFACCERLKTFEIKGTIECIKAAFFDCHSLTTIIIPFPNKFGENFVSRCRNLQKIEFQQTDIF